MPERDTLTSALRQGTHMEKTARHVLSCCLPCLPSCTTPFFPQKRAWHTFFPQNRPLFPLRQRQPDTLSPALSSCLPSRRRVFLHISPRNALLFPQGLIPFIFSSETPSFFPQEVPLSLLAPLRSIHFSLRNALLFPQEVPLSLLAPLRCLLETGDRGHMTLETRDTR